MANELRKTGLSVIGSLPWGTHFCHFYNSKQDLVDISLPYLRAGLENDEFCLWVVADPVGEEEAREILKNSLPEAERHLAEGDIEIVSHRSMLSSAHRQVPGDGIEIVSSSDWYLAGGAFAPERVISGWNAKLAQAVAEGYAGMRVSANESWLTKDNWNDFSHYEQMLDQTLGNRSMIVMCSYPVSTASATEILDVARTHRFAVVKRNENWEILETPGFSRPMPPVFFATPVPQAILRLDNRQFIEVNNAFVQLFGYERGEMIGRAPLDVSLTTDPAELDALIETVSKEGNVVGHETRMRTKSGGAVDIILFLAPIQLAGNECVLATSFDNTERKRAEDEIRQAGEQARKVLDTIPQQIWSGPADGTIDYCNYQWRAYAGLTLEELQGDGWQRILHPDDKDRAVRAWCESVSTGKLFENEERHRRFDGTYRWFLCRGVPLRDSQSRIERWYGSNTDIDDLKRAEDALRCREDELRLVVDTIPVMAWTVRPDGIVDFLSRRWTDYGGITLEQFVADPTGPIHPDDVERVLRKWDVQMALGETYDDEMRLRGADGEYRWFLVRTAPFRDEQGNIVKWYGVSIDIEDRKLTEDELKATSKQLRALSASLQSAREEEGTRIARELHDELGSALTSLKWDLESVDKLCSESIDPSDPLPVREKIKEMIQLLDNTVSAVVRISSELRPTILDDLGLLAAIEWQAQQFESRTGILCQIDSFVEQVDLSREQATAVFRIVQEAMTNVLRHANATRVNITMADEDRDFVLEIRDNGIGITKDQVTASQSLGLIGIRERASIAGGAIEITGAPAKGTVVTLRIPRSNYTSK